MHIEPHHTAEELDRLTARQPTPRLWRRFRAILLAAGGQSAAKIAAALGCTPRAVQKWARRYNDGGADALADHPGRGGKPRLAPADHGRLRERIEAGPTPEDGVCAFHNPDIRRILKAEFGVELGEQAVYDLIHRLGLSSLMPRPIHRKADPDAQEAFKKGLPRGSKRSPRPTRPSGSRSGSPTRRGTGSKVRRPGSGPARGLGLAECGRPNTIGAT
jgi:transposase